VDWYAERIARVEGYLASTNSIDQIIKLQRFVKNYLGRSRFRKVCKLAQKDPQFMHQRLLQTMREGFSGKSNFDLVSPAPITKSQAGDGGWALSLMSKDADESDLQQAKQRIGLNKGTLESVGSQMQELRNKMALLQHQEKMARNDLSKAQEIVDAAVKFHNPIANAPDSPSIPPVLPAVSPGNLMSPGGRGPLRRGSPGAGVEE